MCFVIEATYILANVFANNEKQSITIGELKKIRTDVEQKEPDLFVDISEDAILRAVNQRPDMFAWNNNNITRAENARSNLFSVEYIDQNFNWRIPEEYRSVIKAIAA